jgi:hypothetical protein
MLVRRMVLDKVYGKLKMIKYYHQNARQNCHIHTCKIKRPVTILEGVKCRMQLMWKRREFHT